MNFKEWLNSQEKSSYQLKPIEYIDITLSPYDNKPIIKGGKMTKNLGIPLSDKEFEKYSKLIVPMEI